MLKYLYYGTDQVSPEQIQEELKDVIEKRGDMKMPTPAEVLLERGCIKGIEEGEQRGEQKGEQKGRQAEIREMIVEVLETRFGNVSPPILESIPRIEDIDQLRGLRKNALTASSLNDFEKMLERKE